MAKAMKAIIELGGKTDKSLIKSMMDAEKRMGALKKASGALGGSLKSVAKLAVGAAAGMSAASFVSDAVEACKTFDASMSQVAATMGKTTDELNGEVVSVGDFTGSLRDFAKEMGASTAFSASQAADALNYMALAGYDSATAVGMLPNVLNLAAAGGIDLAYASDMVTDASSALGLDIGETSELVDKMAKASSKSNTSVAQLGEAILVVGGTAKNLAGGTTELSAALGILANNGIKSAEGGTHLRNMLLSLQSPTDKGAAALQDLGVDVFDATGKLNSLGDIFGQLNGQLSQMTDEEKVGVLTDLFNKTDLSAAQAMLAGTVSSVEDLKISLRAMGTAGDDASLVAFTLKGGFEEMAAAAEAGADAASLAQKMAEGYGLSAETAAVVSEQLASAVSGEANDFDKLTAEIDAAKGAAQAMADTQLDNLEGDVTRFNSALEGVQISFGEGLMPALRSFVKLGADGLSSLNDFMSDSGAMDAVAGAAQGIADAVRGAVQAVGEFGSALFGSIDFDGFASAVSGVGDALGSSLGEDSDASAAANVGAMVGDALNNLIPVIEALTPVAGAVADAFTGVMENMDSLLPVAGGLTGAFVTFKAAMAMSSVVEGFSAALNAAKGSTGAMAAAQAALNAVMEANPIVLVVTLIGGLVTALVTAYATSEDFRNAVDGVFSAVGSAIGSAVEGACSLLGSLAQALDFGAIASTVGSVFEAIGRFMTDPIGTARDTIGGIVDAIKGFFSGFHIELPHIKLPHFAVSPPGWQIGDLLQGKIPTLGIEWYAKGGFTHGPVAIAGEAGQEAILSFDPRYRDANIGYWVKAGQMLGVLSAYAAGGFTDGSPSAVSIDIASPTGSLATAAAATGTSGGVTIDFGGVTFAPQVSVSGGEEGDIMAQLRAARDEFFDFFDEYAMERMADHAWVL